MNEVKSSMGDFKIVCKQYEIEVPTIKIDQRELKWLDLKFPSILDEYKAANGINFKENRAIQDNRQGVMVEEQQSQARGGGKRNHSRDSPSKVQRHNKLK